MTRQVLVGSVLAVLLSPPAVAQDAQVDRLILKSGVEVTRVTIRISGRHGRAPRTVKREDFTIVENGVAQPIAVYSATVESPTRVRHELGYSSTTSPSTRKRTVVITVRGFRKKIRAEYTVAPMNPRPR